MTNMTPNNHVPQQPPVPPQTPPMPVPMPPPAQPRMYYAMPPTPMPQPQIDERVVKAKRAASSIGAGFSFIVVLWVAITLLLQSAFMWMKSSMAGWMAITISDFALCVCAIPIGYQLFRNTPLLRTRRFRLRFSQWFVFLLMCLPIMWVGNILGIVLSALLSNGTADNRIATMMTGSNWFVIVIATVIVAPLVEEWLFRKQIIGRLRRYGERPAIVLSALFFGLFHLNLYQFFYAFGLGLLFGYVYTRTSQLRYTVALHMAINGGSAVIATPLLAKYERIITKPDILTHPQTADVVVIVCLACYLVLMLAGLIAGLVLLIRRRQRFRCYTAPDELPRQAVMPTFYGNAGVIVFLCLGVLGTLLMTFVN
ncbi:CPBP family intramembrane glutamic endopeptidase [uncultured Bifidobacterium sp.]|uniref:CPBP family intramembrane glutamic endopeptidase n=1 Tax=uncultured Bifidobacterium sp. TaxID=165187 RepID=UPI002590052F|nr:type II CAAX endopeptidase family protein [uncultured Bifidobacterium sp.]